MVTSSQDLARHGTGNPGRRKAVGGSSLERVIHEAEKAVTVHEGHEDPHPDYQKRFEKGQPNGYAGLDAEGQVPVAQLGTGAAPTKYLRGDQTWSALNLDDLLDVNAPTPSDNQALTWDAATSKWIPETVVGGGSSSTFAGALVYNTTTQSIANSGSGAVIALDAEIFDVGGFHDNVTNNSRFTVPPGKAGKYLVRGCVFWQNGGNATGARLARILKNGASVADRYMAGAGLTYVTSEVIALLDLAVGDYVELLGYQTSGGAMNALGGGTNGELTAFSIARWDDPAASGGGGGGSTLLAEQYHNPSGVAHATQPNGATNQTLSSTWSRVDATVPASGIVFVEIECYVNSCNVIGVNTGPVGGPVPDWNENHNRMAIVSGSGRRSFTFKLTGLTPGPLRFYLTGRSSSTPANGVSCGYNPAGSVHTSTEMYGPFIMRIFGG